MTLVKRPLVINDSVKSKGAIEGHDTLKIINEDNEILAAKILDEGTALERKVLSIRNNQWITAPAYDVTGQDSNGYVNMMKLDESNTILLGAPMKTLENIILPDDPGIELPMVDCLITSDAPEDEEHSYALRLNYSPVLSIFGVADGIGGLKSKGVKFNGHVKGVVNVVKAEVLHTNTTQTVVVNLPAGAIISDMLVQVAEAFNSGTSDYLKVGVTTTDNKYYNNLGLNSVFIDSTVGQGGGYAMSLPDILTEETDITFTYTTEGTAPTQGKAYVHIYYTIF